jgi:hypothetical protein
MSTQLSFGDNSTPYSGPNTRYSTPYASAKPGHHQQLPDLDYRGALGLASHQDLVRSGNRSYQELQCRLQEVLNQYVLLEAKATQGEERASKLQYVQLICLHYIYLTRS